MQTLTIRSKQIITRLTGSRVLRAASSVFMGNGLTLGLALVTSALLARLLGPERFGLVILAITSVNVLAEFLDVRTSEALIRFMGNALAREARNEALTFFVIGLIVDSLVALVALLLALLLVPPVLERHEQGILLRQLFSIYVMVIPFSLLKNTFESLFHTFKQFSLLSSLTVINSLLSVALLALLATQGEVAVIGGYLVLEVLSFALLAGYGGTLLFRHLHGARPEHFRTAWKQFLPFTFHTSAMGSLKAVAVNLDILLLGALRPTSEVTFFKLARSAVSLVALPIVPVRTVIYPLMNEANARQDQQQIQYLIRRFILYSGVISLGTALAFGLAAHFLVFLIYGPDYAPVVPLIYILIVGMVLELIMGWVRTTALIYGRPQLVTFSGFISFVARYGFGLPLIYLYGATGSALGQVVGIVASVATNIFYVLPRLGLWSPFRRQRQIT
jgi:O-antigen/teichoic acid export membrane protein